MLEWSDVKFFLALTQEGSAVAAARRLNTNQTTVSRRIERLEHSLRIKLFEKSSRGYTLTRNGQELLPLAARMEKAANAIENRADRMLRHMSGTIRFSGLVTTMGLFGLPVVDRFRALHPNVQFEIDTQERHVFLEDGECDLAMRSTDEVDGDDLVTRKIDDHPFLFYCSKDYQQKNGAPGSAADLVNHRLLSYSETFAEKIRILGALRDELPEKNIVFRVDSPEGMRAVIKTGVGVGVLPWFLGEEDPDLCRCFGLPWMTHPIWMVASRDSFDTPLVRAFWEFFFKQIPDVRPKYDIA
jgi:DNA-binding transcriptional LysR family regulator